MANIEQDIQDLLKSFARYTEDKIKSELSWTSNLKNDVKVQVEDDEVSLSMPSYGIFVDAGRKPGKQPPLNVIYEWCASKNIPKTAAFPIAKKIGEKGIPAHPFIHIFEDQIDDLSKSIAKSIADSIVKDIQ